MGTPLPAPANAPAPGLVERAQSMVFVAKGFLPMLVYMLLAGTVPLLFFYTTIDTTTDMQRAFIIGMSALGSLLIVAANVCNSWFNITLAFHTAIEVKVVDAALALAMADGTSTAGVTWAWVAAAVIVLHLIPFFVLDHSRLLALLAFVGVPVNVAAALYLLVDHLLLIGLSANVFLLMVLQTLASDCNCPSLLGQFRIALGSGKWLTCERYVPVA